MAPVKNFPAGTMTLPPPALLHAAIASANAFVQSVVPSATAPYSVMSKSRAGNFGGMIRFRMPGTCAHARVAASDAAFASASFGADLAETTGPKPAMKTAPAIAKRNCEEVLAYAERERGQTWRRLSFVMGR